MYSLKDCSTQMCFVSAFMQNEAYTRQLEVEYSGNCNGGVAKKVLSYQAMNPIGTLQQTKVLLHLPEWIALLPPKLLFSQTVRMQNRNMACLLVHAFGPFLSTNFVAQH